MKSMTCLCCLGSPTIPTFQPMVPGTTVAWTTHSISSVPVSGSGKIANILHSCWSEVCVGLYNDLWINNGCE